MEKSNAAASSIAVLNTDLSSRTQPDDLPYREDDLPYREDDLPGPSRHLPSAAADTSSEPSRRLGRGDLPYL